MSRWISTLSQPLRKPHDPIYSPPLRHVRHSVCTHLVYKAFGFPSYGPTVHLICRLSGATVGPYDGDTGCFVLSTNHPVHRLVYKAFGFPSYSPTVHLICEECHIGELCFAPFGGSHLPKHYHTYPRPTCKFWWDSGAPELIPPRKRRSVAPRRSTPLDFSARGSTNILFHRFRFV